LITQSHLDSTLTGLSLGGNKIGDEMKAAFFRVKSAQLTIDF